MKTQEEFLNDMEQFNDGIQNYLVSKHHDVYADGKTYYEDFLHESLNEFYRKNDAGFLYLGEEAREFYKAFNQEMPSEEAVNSDNVNDLMNDLLSETYRLRGKLRRLFLKAEKEKDEIKFQGLLNQMTYVGAQIRSKTANMLLLNNEFAGPADYIPLSPYSIPGMNVLPELDISVIYYRFAESMPFNPECERDGELFREKFADLIYQLDNFASINDKDALIQDYVDKTVKKCSCSYRAMYLMNQKLLFKRNYLQAFGDYVSEDYPLWPSSYKSFTKMVNMEYWSFLTEVFTRLLAALTDKMKEFMENKKLVVTDTDDTLILITFHARKDFYIELYKDQLLIEQYGRRIYEAEADVSGLYDEILNGIDDLMTGDYDLEPDDIEEYISIVHGNKEYVFPMKSMQYESPA